MDASEDQFSGRRWAIGRQQAKSSTWRHPVSTLRVCLTIDRRHHSRSHWHDECPRLEWPVFRR